MSTPTKKTTFAHIPEIRNSPPTLSHIRDLQGKSHFSEPDIFYFMLLFFWKFQLRDSSLFHTWIDKSYADLPPFHEVLKGNHYLILHPHMLNDEDYPLYEEYIRETPFFKDYTKITGHKFILFPLMNDTNFWVTMVLIFSDDAKSFRGYLINPQNLSSKSFSSDSIKKSYSFDLQNLSRTFFGRNTNIEIENHPSIILKETHHSGISSSLCIYSVITSTKAFLKLDPYRISIPPHVQANIKVFSIANYKELYPIVNYRGKRRDELKSIQKS